MYAESDVEKLLKTRLNEYGFEVLKLYTPGSIGTMDRLILRPRYSPGPPRFLEVKRPGKRLRELQAAKAADWRRRGADVLPPCHTKEEVEQLCDALIAEIMPDFMKWDTQ